MRNYYNSQPPKRGKDEKKNPKKKILPKKNKTKTNEVRRTFFTRREINNALVERADQEERSASWIINQALKKYLGLADA